MTFIERFETGTQGEVGVRGIADRAAPRPRARALVIGLGGSGIQTISRVRSAIRGDRPDAAADDSVQFLGIDAVDTTNQVPELPPGTGLRRDEFLNVTAGSFDPASYVGGLLADREDLRRWWDSSYQPPSGAVDNGLKRSRMLGRLAFYRIADELKRELRTAIQGTSGIDAAAVQAGNAQASSRLDIFIVGSSCGGTGSSGYLEVLQKIWAASKDLPPPKIHMFVYLPGAFSHTISEVSVSPTRELRAHRANAYAFFRELDHFLTRSDQLNDYAASPEPGGLNVGRTGLVHQIYAVDSMMRNSGSINSITDLYEITAESIYNLLMTDIGRPLVGANAANTEELLQQPDNYGKPRTYCGLGIARVVFPGDTFRNYALTRFADWYLRGALLHSPEDLPQQVLDHDAFADMRNGLTALLANVRQASGGEDEDELRQIAADAPVTLREDDSVEMARRVVSETRNAEAPAQRAIQSAMTAAHRVQIQAVDAVVQRAAMGPGLGVPFAAELVRRVEGEMQKSLGAARDRVAKAVATLERYWDDEVAESLRELEEAHGANILRRAARVNKSASDLGQALTVYGENIIEKERAAAEMLFLEDLCDHLRGSLDELLGARTVLEQLAEEMKVAWTQDSLLGKDAGPVTTTALVPSDAQPEVEHSTLAQTIYEGFTAEVGDSLLGPMTTDFFAAWCRSGEGRGPFALGSTLVNERNAARRSLLVELEALSRRHALADRNRKSRLPESLGAAADLQADGQTLLTKAFQSLSQLSEKVCLSWTAGRMNAREGQADPTVTTAIAAPASVRDRLIEVIGDSDMLTDAMDQERVVALSVEWGIPMHAMASVDVWRKDYLSTLEAREDDPRSEAPPHVDVRFATELDDLMPNYYKQADAALGCGQALMISTLIKDPGQAELVRALFDGLGRSEEVPRPLRTLEADTGERAYLGTITRIQDGRVIVDRDDVDLGDDIVELFETVGRNVEYRESVRRFVNAATVAAGWNLVDEIESYRTGAFATLREFARGDAEVERFAMISDALEDWRDHLRQAAASV